MNPKKHVKQMEKVGKRRSRNSAFSFIVVLLTSAFLLGPLIHEISHMVLLDLINCDYTALIQMDISGLYGSIQPLCGPEKYQTAIFYGLGYFTTIISGGLFSFYPVWNKSLSRSKTVIYSALGTGLLASTMMALSIRGDISNISELLGLSHFYTVTTVLLLYIGISALIIRSLEILWDESEG